MFTLTGTLKDHAGKPVADSAVVIIPSPSMTKDTSGNTVYLGGTTVYTNSSGVFTASLVANEDLIYTVRSAYGGPLNQPIHFDSPADGTTVNLSDVTPVMAPEDTIPYATGLPTTASDGQILTYDESSGKWVARSGTSVSLAENAGVVQIATDDSSARVAGLMQGKNLYNPADPGVTPGFYVNWTTGNLSPSATYTTTAHIPVTVGQAYTVSGPRSAAFYDAAGAYVAGTAVNNAALTPVTMTAPASAATLRASFTNGHPTADVFQIEKGSTPTAYEPYGFELNPTLTAGVLADAKSYTDTQIASMPAPDALPSSGLERLRTLRDFAAGDVNVAVVSDSTANDANDWLRVWALKWGATLPAAVRRTYRDWDANTLAWRSETVDAAGTTPAGGASVTDTFTRTGDVFGSTPDSGAAWGGHSARWTADGTHATLTAQGGISQDLGSRDQTSTWTLTVTTSALSVDQNLRFYAGSSTALLQDDLWVVLTINTGGDLLARLYKTISGTTTALTASTVVAGAVTNSGTAQTVTVELSIAIQQVSAVITCAGQTTTLAGTVTESDYGTFGTFAGAYGYKPTAGTYGFKIDAVTMTTPEPTPYGTLAVHNGAVAGAGLSHFDAAKRAAMFGGLDVDVLILSTGHNYGVTSPASFTATVETWVGEWLTEHPDCAVIVVSQNPQFSPASTVGPHRDRQAALRLWAKRQGHDYVPVFEAFTAEADGGQSLVSADGIHPTTPPSGITGDYGSVFWADTFTAAI